MLQEYGKVGPPFLKSAMQIGSRMLASFISSDPISPTLLLLAVLWLAAKLGGELAIRLSLPAVTGELGVGIALAALHTRIPVIPDVAASPEAEFLGTLGIIVLMFAVGLESTVPQMMRIGLPAMRVAVVGVIAPALASIAGTWCLLPQGTPPTVDLFIGSCLCATSIGISVKVLREKSASSTTEGRVIVGAAVIDDVLGLLVLVAVTSIVTSAGAGEALPWSYFMKTLGLAVGFLALALTLGRYTTSILFNLANRFRSEQILLPICLGFAFLLAWLGNLAGLAPIVGAYSAGLILEPAHIRVLEERELHQLDDLIHPLVVTLSPLFFVLMGAKVNPATLVEGRTLFLAFVLAILGVGGKFVAGYAAGKGFRPSVIGWGMVPRGEVGLIFVATGSTLVLSGKPLLEPYVQAAIVGALILTTVLGPIGLGWVLRSPSN